MNKRKVELLKLAYTINDIPPPNLPEMAMMGRSNVGKSSLINKLVGEKKIAHVSSRPGKTESINFYTVDDKLNIVDLPGMGYAKRSLKDKGVWSKLVDAYIEKRSTIACVFHLVDFRHGFLDKDLMLQEWLSFMELNVQVLFTKVDKVSKGRRKAMIDSYMKTEGISSILDPLLISVVDNEGIDDLWSFIDKRIINIRL